MRPTPFLRFLFLVLLLAGTLPAVRAQKQLCLTVDDLPTVTRLFRTPEQQQALTDRLLAQLKAHGATATGFAVGEKLLAGNRLDSGQVRQLRAWLEAGMELGNHTFAHRGFNAISAADYLADVQGADTLLRPLLAAYGQPLRYFRHPYLQRGNTPSKRDSLEQYLTRHGYREAPVTVDNGDYLFSAAYETALSRNDTALSASVGRQYVDYMMACVQYYEAQADSLFGRPIPQVLLLHANTLNSFYLGTLLARLREAGYEFVSLDTALRDPAYRTRDAYVNRGGISWLHRWALTASKRGAFFRGEPEVPAAIQALAQTP